MEASPIHFVAVHVVGMVPWNSRYIACRESLVSLCRFRSMEPIKPLQFVRWKYIFTTGYKKASNYDRDMEQFTTLKCVLLRWTILVILADFVRRRILTLGMWIWMFHREFRTRDFSAIHARHFYFDVLFAKFFNIHTNIHLASYQVYFKTKMVAFSL